MGHWRAKPWQGLLLVGCCYCSWWMVDALDTAPQHHAQLVANEGEMPTNSFRRLLDASRPPPPPSGSNNGPPPPPAGGSRPPPAPLPIMQFVKNGETQLTQTFPPPPPGGGGGPPPGPPPKDRPPPPGGNVCSMGPFLLTRNDEGGDTSNGNCDNAENSTILSCTCLDGFNASDNSEWNFVLTPKQVQPSSITPPTSMNFNFSGMEVPLEVNSIATLLVPGNIQTVRFLGKGDTPLPIKFGLPGSDASQLVTVSTMFGLIPQLTTVEISNLDMSKVVLGSGFLPRMITNLTLHNCNLSAIYTGFLTSFQQLRTLDVSKNRLTNIFDGLLQGSCGSSSCSIHELNLNYNNFTKIPALLTSLSNLKIVRLSGNPIRFPAAITSDLFKFIDGLELFEFNATVSGDPIKDDQLRAANGSSCGTNGFVHQAHNVAFCVASSTSSSGPGSSDGKQSTLVLSLIIVGSILFFIVLVFFMKFLFCRSTDGPDFTFTSRFKNTQRDLENTAGVYGAGDGSGNCERSGANDYELFEGDEDTYGYDDGSTGIDLSLLQDPFLVTARIPFDAIRFGNCMKKGGFGVVYNGIYNRRRIAIKKLRNDRSANLRNVENFIKEVCLIASLKHPRIVEFIGVAWDSLRNFCAITELMEKGDLKQVLTSFSKRSATSKANMRKLFMLKRGMAGGVQHDGNGGGDDNSADASMADGLQSMEFPEFSWQNHKRRIMSHVAEALTYLHSLQPKVIHRDLKSKNILLNKSMEAKLSDFGIARERKIDESHMMTAGVGTSFWIAPEVLLGKDYDERADIFSFGVVMCEMDTGEYPYRQMNQIAQAAQRTAAAGGGNGDQQDGGAPPKARSSNSAFQYTTILQLVAHGQLRPEMSVNCPPEIAELAADCLGMDPALRPTAAEIVYRLSQMQLPDSLTPPSDREDISVMEEVDE